MKALLQTLYMAERGLMSLLRQPFWIVFTLVQPIIWLVLYGQLFRRVVELPGFETGSYITFLTPGIVVTTALFAGGWNGMSLINDLDRGIIDRFLLTPASRFALIAGRIVSLSIPVVVQSLILIGLGFIMGARFAGGLTGIVLLFASSILLAAAFGALSNALALTVRREESVIGASNMLLLPLTFLSPTYMAKALMPGWMRGVSLANPVSWSVEASRDALISPHPDWAGVSLRFAALVALAFFSVWVATGSFRAYQRSI